MLVLHHVNKRQVLEFKRSVVHIRAEKEDDNMECLRAIQRSKCLEKLKNLSLICWHRSIWTREVLSRMH